MKLRLVAFLSLIFIGLAAAPATVYAFSCGGKNYKQVQTSINFGCKGIGNPVNDIVFAVLRFLSVGVGFIIVGSLMYAGIQYIFSRDDPSAVSAAKTRIQHTIIALLMYIFAYAILNFILPGGLFV